LPALGVTLLVMTCVFLAWVMMSTSAAVPSSRPQYNLPDPDDTDGAVTAFAGLNPIGPQRSELLLPRSLMAYSAPALEWVRKIVLAKVPRNSAQMLWLKAAPATLRVQAVAPPTTLKADSVPPVSATKTCANEPRPSCGRVITDAGVVAD